MSLVIQKFHFSLSLIHILAEDDGMLNLPETVPSLYSFRINARACPPLVPVTVPREVYSPTMGEQEIVASVSNCLLYTSAGL